ncbi:MAG: NGG1p interacting factor NIF3 [Candidatus Yanofskybacteria bacterium]|nr:NGG1p interacting factor NIF3 [Candidatus Yanofskybacteria bacterium]
MTIKEFYNYSIQKGIDADFRTNEYVEKLQERRRKKYEKMSEEEKAGFDTESLTNPYSDSRILHLEEDREIKRVMVGIDFDVAELLVAKELGDVDLMLAHHPHGRALSDMHEVMELQADIFQIYGVPINIGEGLMKERISEVARGLNPRNNWRAVDVAVLLKTNFACVHTPADNISAQFVREAIEKEDPERVEDLLKVLSGIGEYKKAIARGTGPKIFVGQPENRLGKILVDMTGGTEGSPKLYEKMANAGIGTLVSMHISEDHKKEAEASHLNIIVAGHMSSDSIGMNLLVDELERSGTEIIPAGGFLRVSRV